MRDDKAAVDGHPGASAAGEAIEMSDDAKSLGGRSHKGGNKEDQDERTPRLPASRPTSAYDLAVPTLNLPQAALPDTRMPTPAASVPVEDQADLSATSYFEVRYYHCSFMQWCKPIRQSSFRIRCSCSVFERTVSCVERASTA
jgi:hypothetical protein